MRSIAVMGAVAKAVPASGCFADRAMAGGVIPTERAIYVYAASAAIRSAILPLNIQIVEQRAEINTHLPNFWPKAKTVAKKQSPALINAEYKNIAAGIPVRYSPSPVSIPAMIDPKLKISNRNARAGPP
jgi:hypothetical protein